MPATSNSTLPLLRLLQITDSSFPVGGFAFSHGIEWMAQQASLTEENLRAIVDAYVRQSGGGQWLPSAAAAYGAAATSVALRADRLLDLSMAVKGEREAGRVMGDRLLLTAADALPGPRTLAHLEAVRVGAAPGQFAVAFGLVAADHGAPLDATLAALGSTMVMSVVQAAVRLGAIGQGAATRLAAGATDAIDGAVRTAMTHRQRLVGAFTPGLDVAGLRHPTLPFRMFAS